MRRALCCFLAALVVLSVAGSAEAHVYFRRSFTPIYRESFRFHRFGPPYYGNWQQNRPATVIVPSNRTWSGATAVRLPPGIRAYNYNARRCWN